MGRVCGSGCPYYGVDEDYNGYCKLDGNSYRERFSDCNMGYGDSSGGSSGGSSSSSDAGGCGCLKWVIIIAVVLGILGGVATLFTRGVAEKGKEPALSQSEQQTVMYTTAEINLRQSPSLSGAKIMVLPEDAAVTVEKTEGEWSYVAYQGTHGWCKSEFLEKR